MRAALAVATRPGRGAELADHRLHGRAAHADQHGAGVQLGDRQIKTTKTEDGRAVPMHPTLAKILATWRLSHWSRLYGRQPTPDDHVVPTRNLTPIDASDAVHAFKADLEALGLSARIRRSPTEIQDPTRTLADPRGHGL